MLCGVVKNDVMVRVGPERYPKAMRSPHAREMDFTGRPMAGYVFVTKTGIRTAAALNGWISLATGFVSELPAKSRKPRLTGPRSLRLAQLRRQGLPRIGGQSGKSQ